MSRIILLNNEQINILKEEYNNFSEKYSKEKEKFNLSYFFNEFKTKYPQFKEFTERQLTNKIIDQRKIFGEKEWPRLYKSELDVAIWSGINFSQEWDKVNTSTLDEILPSWLKKREQLKNNPKEYYYFLEKIKRQHAIETGVIEKLYDLKEGVTETFIREGFVSSYLQHGDTNISEDKLMKYLKDHLSAIDYIFDLVKNNRNLTKSVIKELHQLVTSHQDSIVAKDQFGNLGEVPLLKGQFKKYENNPLKEDGKKFIYCPPIQVESEMDRLIEIYNKKINSKPIVLASWFHHAFTQIHPFQDGNGRIARLLTSLILIKNNLFPFTVVRQERKNYLEVLEEADNGNPQPLVNFFCEVQKNYIENILNLKLNVDSTYEEVKGIFAEKIRKLKSIEQETRYKNINENRIKIFDFCKQIMTNYENDLKTELSDKINVYTDFAYPTDIKKYYNYTHQILEYAIKHNYFFNRGLPRGWFKLSIVLEEERRYQLIITVHHFGYDDSTLAIGAILEFIEPITTKSKRKGSQRKTPQTIVTSLPLEIKPYVISIEKNIDDSRHNIESFLKDVITVALGQISNEF